MGTHGTAGRCIERHECSEPERSGQRRPCGRRGYRRESLDLIEEIRMMECGMWLMRLTLIFGLIGQLLWAQGSLTPRPPCMKQQEPVSAEDSGHVALEPCCRQRQSVQGSGHGCCAGRMAAATRKEPEPARCSAEATSGGCDPANCCKRVPPRPPRPVDRIPAPQKQPMTLMPAIAPAPPLIAPAPVVHRGFREAAPSGSNNTRRAALCVWRN